MIPTWLARHLETTGQSNPDGYGRALRAATCGRCHAPILRGLDADLLALPAAVDPQPISPIGEVAALLAGAQTYDIHTAGRGRAELEPRHHWSIARRHRPVLADHRCGRSWPADPTPPTARPTAKETDEPAF